MTRLNASKDAQRERQRLQMLEDDPSLSESDWQGLLIGLAAAIMAIGSLVILIRFFLGAPQ